MDDIKFFGEWVRYDTDEEKEEASQYLKLWKKFFLKKWDFEIINEFFIDRDYEENFCGNKCPIRTLGLKLEARLKTPVDFVDEKFLIKHEL